MSTESMPMSSTPPHNHTAPDAERSTAMRVGCAVAEIAGVWLVFALHAGWPVPDVNEAHYLGKARHFWDPHWAAGDFFLRSHDTHRVFYWTIGWLAAVLPLPAAAWCGRLATWLLQAAGWWLLCRGVRVQGIWVALSAACFVALSEHGQMAGEWVVGGFEAKGIAYALVFAGLGRIAADRWSTGFMLLGLAASFHVLVGGWSVVAAGVCFLWLGDRRPALRQVIPGILLGGLLALPGVWPALGLAAGAAPEVVAQANFIYVFERLPHHLLPDRFKPWFLLRHALLLGVWYWLARQTCSDMSYRRLHGVVFGAVTITLFGLAILALARFWPNLGASLLRFYWFRMTDSLVPLGCAMSLAAVATAVPASARQQQLARFAMLAIAACYMAQCGWWRMQLPVSRADPPSRIISPDDWREACEWIGANTPPGTVCVTPRAGQTFKWYAQRGELATWKDVPQDAATLVAWWNQLQQLHGTGLEPPHPRWYDTLAEAPLSRTLQVAAAQGATYLLTARQPRLALPCVFQNNTFAVYALPPAPKRDTPTAVAE